MKKLVSVLVSAAMALSVLTAPTIALDYDTPVEEEIIEEYAIFNSLASILTLSGNTAICTSSATAGGAYSITATQKLQKYSGWFWFWDDVATWTKAQNSEAFIAYNEKPGLASGTYRLVTEFTVVSTSGQTETKSATSFERTIS